MVLKGYRERNTSEMWPTEGQRAFKYIAMQARSQWPSAWDWLDSKD